MSLIARGLPCPDTKGCGSSDAAARYENADGEHWIKCFSCGKNFPDKEATTVTQDRTPAPAGLPAGLGPGDIPERRLKAATLKHYGVTVNADGDTAFPYGGPVKVRGASKDFRWVGKAKDAVALFGQDRFTSGGKYVTITEGELDALAAYQMSGGAGPVVSVRNGAQGALADCQAAYEWLDGFETIVIAFDADKAGQEAARKVAELFAGKAKVLKHAGGDLKDACDYLKANRGEEWVKLFWRAEAHRPDGVVNLADLWEEVSAPTEAPMLTWPYPELQTMTDGIRAGELIVLTAGTGIGKSTAARALVDHALATSDVKIGLLFLEENQRITAKRQLGMRLGAQLWRPGVEVDPEALRKAFEEVAGHRRIEVYSHLGVHGPDEILARARYMAKGLGCKLLILDHISIVVSGSEEENERKQIDILMTKLRALVEETQVALVVISHLRRPDKGSHEEGSRITLGHLRGSGAIAQLADLVIAFERNQQHRDPRKRQQSLIRVLKSRYAGEVGPACLTAYDKATGRVVYVGPPDDEGGADDGGDAL